ncbi:cysteine-rich CWC family protein [Caballeronia sp. LZ035]|uniref:cysteine-rich CWC family protein n=1 Tax=Caballeronia sp. LZ035 TaxID=3038568 RepID=UPI0028602102|nr:cysteine-rich CWC family protein [Caballeronia sp. LZ035]MDR5755696.1 cysteine-rich CWC family protein [Caballeronia sp. LZ035]
MAFEKIAAQAPQATSAVAQTCARCGAAFRCGVLAGDAACWCADLPKLPFDQLQTSATCMCPSCLAASIERDGLSD